MTHGGTNGLYEAVYHAVPVVGIPLFADQPDNIARLSRQGAALVLHFNLMTSEELVEALLTVINQPRWAWCHRKLSYSNLVNAVFYISWVCDNFFSHDAQLQVQHAASVSTAPWSADGTTEHCCLLGGVCDATWWSATPAAGVTWPELVPVSQHRHRCHTTGRPAGHHVSCLRHLLVERPLFAALLHQAEKREDGLKRQLASCDYPPQTPHLIWKLSHNLLHVIVYYICHISWFLHFILFCTRSNTSSAFCSWRGLFTTKSENLHQVATALRSIKLKPLIYCMSRGVFYLS